MFIAMKMHIYTINHSYWIKWAQMHGKHFWGFIYRLNHVTNDFPFHLMCSFERNFKFSSTLFICDPHLTLNQHIVKVNRKIIYNRIKKSWIGINTKKISIWIQTYILGNMQNEYFTFNCLFSFINEHFSYFAVRPIFIFHTSNERIFENEIERNI